MGACSSGGRLPSQADKQTHHLNVLNGQQRVLTNIDPSISESSAGPNPAAVGQPRGQSAASNSSTGMAAGSSGATCTGKCCQLNAWPSLPWGSPVHAVTLQK